MSPYFYICRIYKIKSQEPENALPYISEAIIGSSYEGTLGAPLDLLISSHKKFEDLTDENKVKLHKVSSVFYPQLS